MHKAEPGPEPGEREAADRGHGSKHGCPPPLEPWQTAGELQVHSLLSQEVGEPPRLGQATLLLLPLRAP